MKIGLRRLAVAVVVAGVVVAPAIPARAHALLASSDPAEGARLERAPSTLRLTFTEEPDLDASSVRVLSAAGQSVHRGDARADAQDARTLTVALRSLETGVYTVTWRVLSRVDGHVTGGAFTFGVGADPGPQRRGPTTVETPPPSVAGVAGRVLLYGWAFVLIGWAVAALCAPAGARAGRSLARIAWPAGLLGVLLIAQGQAADAGIGLTGLLGTSIGTALLWRLAPIAIAGIAVYALRGRTAASVAAATAAALLLAHVTYGHAGAGSARWIRIGVQWVHASAAAAWIGGLAVLLASIRGIDPGERFAAVRRYSTIALATFLVVAVSGSVRALDEVGSLRALFTTTFGRIVLAKIGLLAVLAVLAAVNRFRNVARSGESPGALVAVGRAELALALVVLVLTGLLTSIAPARPASESATDAVVESGSDFGTTVRLRLRVEPGRPGSNEFTATMRDFDGREPYAADSVRLRFRYAGADRIEPTELSLGRTGAGVFTGTGSNLSLPGPWVVTATVTRGTDVAQIDLTIATRIDQQVSTIPQPGAPTIYDVALGRGSVQFYVDPGRAGRNEVHATFFDEQGQEDARARDAVLVATPPEGEPVRLPVRVLTPGHFVADATLHPGRWRFDVFASDEGGDRLSAYFEESIGR